MKCLSIFFITAFILQASDSIIRLKTPPSIPKTNNSKRPDSPSHRVNPQGSPRDRISKLMKKASEERIAQESAHQ